ncbi:TadE/TadG family type IV pilus assembly protein [Aliiroseovarius sp.]|uniref:Tad domain-containing protein n=1 Tax=Aliiroseovarius sp. TaxID=1872442 RepID=UPI00261D6E21|nr:TadE/TadG family type IV pilus assembly protein [Aliiroseovarius sp.]
MTRYRLRNFTGCGAGGQGSDSGAGRNGLAARFCREEDGSFIIFGLFIFVLMLMIGGLAVDLMRYETHRARLQATLDRAVLAAASMSQPLPPKQVVIDYFEKAGLGGLITEGDITVEDHTTYRRVTADVDMVVSSTFLNFLGIEELTAPGYGAAEESASQTEISLVLDVSGSMGWSSASGNSKIYELRRAAKQFVNILQCDPSDGTATTGCTVEFGKVSISLIPYSEQVLAGEALLARMPDNVEVTAEHTSSSCINWQEADFGDTGLDLTDPNLILQRTGHFDPWRNANSTPGSWTCKTNSWREIMPFVAAHADLRDRIDQLGASGNTSIDIGMKWGTLLLDPSLRSTLTGLIADGEVSNVFADRPFRYDERGISKVVVLMTDGENTRQHYLHPDKREGDSEVWYNEQEDVYSVYRASTDNYYRTDTGEWLDNAYGLNEGGTTTETVRRCTGRRWWRRCWYETVVVNAGADPGDAVPLSFQELWQEHWTWDRYDEFSWLDAGSNYGTSTKDERLNDICTAAKDAGITIFTVGFETSDRSNGVMSSCASSPAHHFDVAGTDLTDAFAAIAREISKLRLVN